MIAGAASEAMEARGLERFGTGHHRQDRGEPPRQHRLALVKRPRTRGYGWIDIPAHTAEQAAEKVPA
jgi:hypothetical protein